MKLSDRELNKSIKNGELSRAYLLCGEEQLSVKTFAERLITAAAGKQPNEFNFHAFSGFFDLNELAAALLIVPFMDRYNVVSVSDMYFDDYTADELNKLLELIKNIPDSTILIFSMPTYIPSKNKAAFSRLIKTIDKVGAVCEFKPRTQGETERLIAKWANTNGKMISHINASKLISCCGNDLTLLKNEVDKLCAYSKSDEITINDIDKLATVNLEAKIFSLSDAVLSGNAKRACEILDLLFYQREEPVMMLYVLSSAYIDAYRMRIADECGVSKKQTAEFFEYKNRAFTLDSAKRAARSVSTSALRKSLGLLIKADTDFKSKQINARIYLEKLIAELMLAARE